MWNRALGRRCLQAIAFAIEWPVLVVLRLHRFPKERIPFRLLSGRFAVIEVDPLGFGDSDRTLEYPQGGVHEQVLAVLDQEAVGYSQGAPWQRLSLKRPRVRLRWFAVATRWLDFQR